MKVMKVRMVPNRNANHAGDRLRSRRLRRRGHRRGCFPRGRSLHLPRLPPRVRGAFEAMERLTMDIPELQIEAPFMTKAKAEIVGIVVELGVPFEETWSCYKGGELHCDACGTCVERRKAFVLAGVHDPTQYREHSPRKADVRG